MTIVDLMTKSDADISLSHAGIRLQHRGGKWIVQEFVYWIGGMYPLEIIKTESESKAVAAFCEAAGIEVIK